jgi:hypothetical protein
VGLCPLIKALATLHRETIEPFFNGIIIRAACFIPRKTPFTFMSNIFSNSNISALQISERGEPDNPIVGHDVKWTKFINRE